MTPTELVQLGITDALRLIRSRQLSPVELVRAYLERITRLNPTLNVYLTVMAEEALAAATAAERAVINGEQLGTLHGIPIGLKDNCDVPGVRMTAGSKFLQDHVATGESEVAARLRRWAPSLAMRG